MNPFKIEKDCDTLEDIKAKIMRLARKAREVAGKYELDAHENAIAAGESQAWFAAMDLLVNGNDNAGKVHGPIHVSHPRQKEVVNSLDDIQEGIVDYLIDCAEGM